jgi:hypothetical protein
MHVIVRDIIGCHCKTEWRSGLIIRNEARVFTRLSHHFLEMGPGAFKLGKLTSFLEKLGKASFRGKKLIIRSGGRLVTNFGCRFLVIYVLPYFLGFSVRSN